MNPVACYSECTIFGLGGNHIKYMKTTNYYWSSASSLARWVTTVICIGLKMESKHSTELGHTTNISEQTTNMDTVDIKTNMDIAD
jgi:hypothetical protein